MFIAGNPKLVIEQCKAGVVGSFPALNARPKEKLDEWLTEIETELAGAPADVIPKIHAYGGIVLHDVISVRHAEKALEDGAEKKVWRDIWSAGQIDAVVPVAGVLARLESEYGAARQRLQM
jgi:nitronate monooxygenase